MSGSDGSRAKRKRTSVHPNQCGDVSDSASDSDDNDRHHCTVCTELCFTYQSYRCACGTVLCQNCCDFCATDGEGCCYASKGFDSNDFGCFKCILKDPSSWCRDVTCPSPFNVVLLLPRLFEKGLARDLIPGGHDEAAARINKYNEIVARIVEKPLTAWKNKELGAISPFVGRGLNKKEMCQRAEIFLASEKSFEEKYKYI